MTLKPGKRKIHVQYNCYVLGNDIVYSILTGIAIDSEESAMKVRLHADKTWQSNLFFFALLPGTTCVNLSLFVNVKAIDKLLESGTKTVVITGVEVEDVPRKLVLLAKNKSGKRPYSGILMIKSELPHWEGALPIGGGG